MPAEDVLIRAIWGKNKIVKSMDGKVEEKPKAIIKKMYEYNNLGTGNNITKIVFQNDLADAKSQLFKVQLAFARKVTPEDFKDVELLSFTKQGSIVYVLVRGEAAETSAKIEALKPLIMDMLPLSIEEVFTYELSSLGYNFDEIK